MTSYFSSTSVETTLQNAISTSGATSMLVANGTGTALMGGITLAPGNVDVFTVAIDVDTINEEIVFITNQSTDTMTIVRGRAGTSAVAHSAGASVKHVLSSYDLTNFQGAVTPVTSLGFGGSTSGTTTVQANAIAGTNTLTLPATTSDTLVGRATTDTLTNKTINFNNNTITNLPAANLDITFNAKTANYTLISSDVNKLVTMSDAGTLTLTVPNGVFTTGQQINVQRLGAGAVQIRSDGTSVLTSTGTTSTAPNLRAQYSAATIICTSSNNFTVIGDLS